MTSLISFVFAIALALFLEDKASPPGKAHDWHVSCV
jgi:hypothetical protein